MNLDSLSKSIKDLRLSPAIGFIICLVLIVCYNFYPALDNDFVYWDDQFYITENPFIIDPSFEHFRELWTKIISLNYHPLTMISFWVNSFFSGIESASPFIATNVLLHIGNTILVFIFIKKLLPEREWIAFTTALIFGIHPMHVESVVWISERKDVLYCFFFLGSLCSYLDYLKNGRNFNYLTALILFLFSCGAKAMAVALVPVLYLLDFFKLRSFNPLKIHVEKIPFFIIGLLVGIIALDVQAGGDFYGLLEQTSDARALNKSVMFGVYDRIIIASYGLFFYCFQFFVPFDLAAIHPYNAIMGESYLELLPLFSLAMLLSLVYGIWKERKLAFAIGFFLLNVILVLQFIPVGVAVVAERYTYLPYIGLGFLLGFFLEKTIRTQYVKAVGLIFITIYLSILTREQVDVWQNQISLFSNAIEVYPENPYAREFLATGYFTEGNYDKAIHHLMYTVDQIGYQHTKVFEQLGLCWDAKSEAEKALEFFDKSIELDSLNYTARYHRSLTLLDIDPSAALEDLIFCKKAKSEYLKPLLYEPLARSYGSIGAYEKSIEAFTNALEFSDEIEMTYYNRGITYERMGEIEKAIQDYEKSLSYDKNFELAKQRIALLNKKRKE